MRQRSKGKKRKTGVYLLILVVIGFCFILGNGKKKSLEEEKALQQKKEKLQADILAEEERAEMLSDEEAYRQTKQYLEKIAREKMGLVKPEDIIIRGQETE